MIKIASKSDFMNFNKTEIEWEANLMKICQSDTMYLYMILQHTIFTKKKATNTVLVSSICYIYFETLPQMHLIYLLS